MESLRIIIFCLFDIICWAIIFGWITGIIHISFNWQHLFEWQDEKGEDVEVKITHKKEIEIKNK